jgi:two-component system response regulator FixJ
VECYSSDETARHAYVLDDDSGFRKSLVLLLECAGWRTRGFASVSEFLEECPKLQPGALLLDIRMPEIGGLDLLESGEPWLVNFAVIVVSGHGDVDSVVRSLKAGAIDFIEKPFSGPDLLAMLDATYGKLLEGVDFARREMEAHKKVACLSAREMDVLAGLLAGAPYKAIGRYLGISDRTVEMYRNNMVRKLGARTTAEALHIGVLAKVKPADFRQSQLPRDNDRITIGKSL